MPPSGDDVQNYYRFMGKSMIEKSVNNLVGIINGIKIDSLINDGERGYLHRWLLENGKARGNAVMNELISYVENAIQDNVIQPEEKAHIDYLVQGLSAKDSYFGEATTGIQVLHGMLGGISGDGIITELELARLQDWINDNYHLKGSFPFDEIESIVHEVMRDRRIDDGERELLMGVFAQFQRVFGRASIDMSQIHIDGVCAMNPEVEFRGRNFCFTGISTKMKRKDISELILRKGGIYHDSVISKTEFLVIGVEGNPCWAFSCYGRKVEKAMQMRKEGGKITLVNERDFWDACN